MTKEDLKNTLSGLLPELEFPEINNRLVNVRCTTGNLKKVAEFLKTNDALKFDFLFSLTAIDWPDHLEIIYHLRSTEMTHEMVLRVKTEGRENPQVNTVSDIWPTADFHEREVFDLFGVQFINHPDLRRIFLEDDWVGYPLRKDYTDEINIVEL